MTIKCDQCKKGNKGRYRTFMNEIKDQDGKSNFYPLTLCYDCMDQPIPMGRTDKGTWEHISTPFWQHAGLPPKPHEQAEMKYMKDHNMSWGDMRKAREYGKELSNQGKIAFNKHVDKYGRGNAPDARFNKESN